MPDVAATVLPPRTLNLIVGLLRAYMALAAEQVTIYNQKWRIPADNRLYISVGYIAQKPYGTTSEIEEFAQGDVTGLKEVTSVSSQETISLNVFSRSQAAVDRKDEILLALGSTRCAQLCDANAIKIGKLPVGFTDVSSVEGTSRLNRFVVTINALVARKQERVIEYFDKFEPTGLIINP